MKKLPARIEGKPLAKSTGRSNERFSGYSPLLADLKSRVRTAQVKAALAANRELLTLYWDIGRLLRERQTREGWGAAVIPRLSRDLRAEFPEMQGFSERNIGRMVAFHREYPGLFSIKNRAGRFWYMQQVVAHGWSRAMLMLQIESRAHARAGRAVNNFALTLSSEQSDLAQQTLKDPYVFDFLTLGDAARERELEDALTTHIQKFLVALGVGFAFVGRQVPLVVAGRDYSLDLLFYHLRLRCYVVIDLKVEEFKPEFAGKMNFYLSGVDAQLRHPADQPTIGLLLCRGNNRLTVEYALRDMKKPIGVADWKARLIDSLPKKLRGALPSVAELERELE
ncbi:MAG: DUF1016 domain-containing protein [Opitutae bacterium]|nr:DUF1016 domain-containing protein [Opitutae bacterium]